MLEPTNTWPDTNISANVLFVAQLIKELIDPDSFESHRVFSLDTISRLEECIELYADSRKSRVTKSSLEDPFDEVCWSVRIDPVVSVELSNESIESICGELKKRRNYSEAHLAAVYLRNKLAPVYKHTLENQILEHTSSLGRRNFIRKLVSFYCSYLINSGYSRSYISESADLVFFNDNHSRVSRGKVRTFFNRFPNVLQEHFVYAEVSSDFGEILEGLDFEVKPSGQRLSHQDKDVKTQFPIHEANSYALVETQAKDRRSALIEVNAVLENVRALSFLNPGASSVTWSPKYYVVKKRQRQGDVFDLPESPLDWLSPQTTSNPSILKDIRRYSNRIFDNFDVSSIRRILKSVSTASSARYSPNVELQLVSLWSAVEGLLSEPIDDTPRITHFCNLMLPCICNRHLHRRSIYLYEKLLSSYRNRFRSIVLKEPDYAGRYEHYRFTAILMFRHNEQLRKDILSLASNNPLALNRLHQFYEDCRTPKKLVKAIESHEKRVNWQLSRIYRVRNSLVHKGEKPGHLDSIVLNMFEYYIRMLACIVRSASKTDDDSDLDQIVSGVYLDSITMKRLIRSKCKDNLIDHEVYQILNA